MCCQEIVEDVADVVDELVDVRVEVAVVGGDHGESGLVFDEHEPGEVHGLELVECGPDRVLLRRCRLNLVKQGRQRVEIRLGFDRHDERQRILNGR